MKRSLSLANSNTPKNYRRFKTFSEKTERNAQDLLSFRASALPGPVENVKKNDFFGTPISLYGKKINPRIMPSDFWSSSMRMKLRRISESQIKVKNSSEIKKEKIKCFPIVGDRFKRASTERSLNLAGKGKICTIKSLEDIIDDCTVENVENKQLGTKLKLTMRNIVNDYGSIKRLIK